MKGSYWECDGKTYMACVNDSTFDDRPWRIVCIDDGTIYAEAYDTFDDLAEYGIPEGAEVKHNALNAMFDWRFEVDLPQDLLLGEMSPTQRMFVELAEKRPVRLRRPLSTPIGVGNDINHIETSGLEVSNVMRRKPAGTWQTIPKERLK